MFSLTFTRVSEERERDLIRFHKSSGTPLVTQTNNKPKNPNSKRDKRKSQTFLLYDVLHASASISCAIKLTSSLD